MSKSTLAVRFDSRKASGFRDSIGRPCNQCAVATVADPVSACKYYRVEGPPCVVAKGRYRRTLRSALPVIGERVYLEPSVERYASLCGQIEQSKIERAALLGAGQSVDELDDRLNKLHREASKAMRESGLAANVSGMRDPDYDTQVFSK